MIAEYFVGLVCLFIVGLILGVILNVLKHSGGGAEGAMIEGAFWLGVGELISVFIFLFLGLRDSGAWVISYLFG